METFRGFGIDPTQKYWLKSVVAMNHLQKPLERLIDEESEIFYSQLLHVCGPARCEKGCNLNNWKPNPKGPEQVCVEVCSVWKNEILKNHTRRGKLSWVNSIPSKWCQDKREVIKVYMQGGHKNHNSISDFDIAAIMNFMNQCKHFEKFELGGLCEKISSGRNKIMHSPRYQLEQKELYDFLARIRELAEKLAKFHPEFKNLSNDIDEIQNLDFTLSFPNNSMAAQEEIPLFWKKENQNIQESLRSTLEMLEQHLSARDKEIQALQALHAAQQGTTGHALTRLKLARQMAQQREEMRRLTELKKLETNLKLSLEREMASRAQQEQDNTRCLEMEDKARLRGVETAKDHRGKMAGHWAAVKEAAQHSVTRKMLKELERRRSQEKEAIRWARAERTDMDVNISPPGLMILGGLLVVFMAVLAIL